MQEEREQLKKQKAPIVRQRRIVFVLVIAVLLVYFGGQIISAYSGVPTTVPATQITMNDSFSAVGWFFRDETTIAGKSSDTIKHIVYSGERVHQNSTLAIVYSDEEALALSRELDPLDERIELLDTALESANSAGADASKTDKLIVLALQQMADQVKNGSGSSIASSIDSLHTLSLRREASSIDTAAIESERAQLAAERDQISAQLSGRSEEISATESGYFSEVVDGYESILTLDTLENITPESFQDLISTEPTAVGEDTLGKIVKGFHWYLACEVPVENADSLEKGQTVRIQFTQSTLETKVTVYAINKTKNSDTAIVIFEGTEINSDLVSMRNQPVEIILNTYTGLKVPKQAVRLQTDSEGNSTMGVFILSGSVQRFKSITPLFETDDFYIVQQSATDTNSLVAQDQIIVKGKGLQNNMVVK